MNHYYINKDGSTQTLGLCDSKDASLCVCVDFRGLPIMHTKTVHYLVITNRVTGPINYQVDNWMCELCSTNEWGAHKEMSPEDEALYCSLLFLEAISNEAQTCSECQRPRDEHYGEMTCREIREGVGPTDTELKK